MKINSKALAKMCVALLVLYPVSAFLVWTYLDSDKYGIMAVLFASNAGTAFFAGLVFGLPEFIRYTSKVLRLLLSFIGVASGLMSAIYWMWDEVEHIWLRVVIISPVLVILFVLMWFVDKVNKEGTKHEGE